MEKTNRRNFLKAGIFSAGGLVAATVADTGKYVPISEGRDLNKTISNLESEYLNPGVTVSAGTDITMRENGSKIAVPRSEISIEMGLWPDDDIQLKKAVDNIKITDEDKENVHLLSRSIAGPYTAIAVVGSAANQKTDKAASDIDILVLNGSDKVYPTRQSQWSVGSSNSLFDNQRKAVRTNFRPAHYEEVIKHIHQYNPEKADKMLEAIRNKELLYGPFMTDEFLKRNKVNMDPAKDKSKLLHLLGPTNDKEGAAYNVKTLNNALQRGQAILLYQGKNNKLIKNSKVA